MMAMKSAAALAALLLCNGEELRFQSIGGIPNSESLETAWQNGRLLNKTLNSMLPGDVIVFEKDLTFTTMGGIVVENVTDVVVRVDGILKFTDHIDEWPRSSESGSESEGGHAILSAGHVLECLHFINSRNLTITSSSHRGTLHGNGNAWWWLPGFGYLRHVEDRPRILSTTNCSNVVVEKILFLDSPYWTTFFRNVNGLTIRHSDISARRTGRDGHAIIDLTAFNTDGFDFSGRNIHVHDVTVYSQDDCITIKDGTENVLVERVNASGVGLTIGSIGRGSVRNVTFRDSILHNSHKGIYLKFRHTNNRMVTISDVLYENIIIDNNEQWPIWIGPAQQSDTASLCYANPCSICWPTLPGASCFGMPYSMFSNLMFRNIQIRNPKSSPGVILADPSYPIYNLTFEDVRVTQCVEKTTSFKETFPNLPLDIYDPYVTDLMLLIAAACVIFLILPLVACWYKGVFTKAFWNEHGKLRTCTIVTFVLLTIFAVVFGGWMGHVNAQVGDVERYFKCEGVQNAVALGNTWPVPSCFIDKTQNSTPSKKCTPVVVIILGSATGLVLVALLAGFVLKRFFPDHFEIISSKCFCRRNSNQQNQRLLQPVL